MSISVVLRGNALLLCQPLFMSSVWVSTLSSQKCGNLLPPLENKRLFIAYVSEF